MTDKEHNYGDVVDDIWTETGGVSIRVRKRENGGVVIEFTESGVGTEATASHVIAPFRLERLANAIFPGTRETAESLEQGK